LQEPILRIALPNTTGRLFDYLAPHGIDSTNITVGMRVKVPFRASEKVGLITDILDATDVSLDKLKRVLDILDRDAILPADLYKLCSFTANYYHFPFGETLLQVLPMALKKGLHPKTIPFKEKNTTHELETALTFNEAQQQAYDVIHKNSDTFNVFLLDGVTGSGKTEVYLQLIAEKITEQKQVLILLPEISLTPQTIARFAKRFSCPLAAYHSHVSPKEKLSIWQHVKDNHIRIVIGTRSALFLPFATLALIIIDEEHDPSFKQQDRLRYHARDLAIVRAHHANIPVILGSATPSLESLLNAKRNKYTHLILPNRAGTASLPQIDIIDLNHTKQQNGIATTLLTAIQHELTLGNQVMLFLNRRGFAPVVYCTQCKTVQVCHACDSKLVYHTQPNILQCHHCDTKFTFPKPCDACQENTLIPLGTGTQRLEETLQDSFAEVPIYRIDRDSTTKKGTMQTIFNAIHQGTPAILLGTQMLAKGHHFPHVTLVCVIDVDSGLLSTNFRAREHIGQLLLQVSGRAGRAEKPGKVYIQTFQPTHPLLTLLTQSGYAAFADYLLKERESANLPPYSYFALLSAEAKTARDAKQWLMTIKQTMCHNRQITLLGPMTANMAKRRGFYREQLIFQAPKRHILQSALQELQQYTAQFTKKQVRYTLDVDPIDLE